MKLIKNSLLTFMLVLILLLSLGSLQASNIIDDGDSVALDDTSNELITNSATDDTNNNDNNTDETSWETNGEENNNPTQDLPKELSYNNLTAQIDAANNEISLDYDYIYNSSSDSTSGIYITKDLKIIGNNHFIDGNKLARGLRIGSGCNVVLEGIVFKNCYSTESGGAIQLGSKSNLTIRNCDFINNKVYNANGASIYGTEFNKINIYDSNFISNSAIRNSTLPWKSFKKGMGSAIVINGGSNLNLFSSNFKNNDAYVCTVLVVSYNDNDYKLSTTYVKDCKFENNTSRSNAIFYLDELGKGQFINSLFKNNKVKEEGTILMLQASKLAVVKNCKFEKNSAPHGAINLGLYEKKVTTANITSCNFSANKADSGAAIYSSTGKLIISKCRFTSNTATKSGGAVTANKGSLKVTNSYFYNNRAVSGGAIYSLSTNTVISGSNFSSNTVSKCGGALSTDTKGSIKISNSKFYKNHGMYGGAIYSKLKNVVSTKNTFSKNTVSKTGADVFGVLNAQISKVSVKAKKVKLKVQLSSPWKNLLVQKFKIKLYNSKRAYYTKALKTNSKGLVTGTITKKVASGKYTATISVAGTDFHLTKLSLKV